MRGARKKCYGCIGHTLYKPKVITAGTLDIRAEHLAFLHGKRPTTVTEKRVHALLVHENTHSERQFQAGVWWHQLRYICSASFRLKEEQAAYAAEIAQLVRYQLRVRSTRIAKLMSGPVYRQMCRNMVGYEDALRWAQDTIRAAEIEFFAECMKSDDASSETDESTAAVNTGYEKIASARPINLIKDRIALVCCAAATFVVVQLIVFAVAFLSGEFGAKH